MGEGGSIQLPLIYEAAGLPAEYLTAEFVRARVIPCVAATFSDGELVIQHSVEEDPVAQEHFGAQSYDQGTFGQRLRALFEGDNVAMRHQVDGLIRYSANVFAHDVTLGNTTLPRHQNVIIHGQAVEFDHRSVPLARPPQVVVDYGPGLQGRLHVDRQLADWDAGVRPYAYLAVGKGPFVNEFLQQYWAARLGDDPQLFRSVIGGGYVYRTRRRHCRCYNRICCRSAETCWHL
jgi:hypothetical protein